MQIVRTVVIDRHIEDVFDYVADPLNDPAWHPAVLLVDQVEGDGPGPGARYQVLHRPRGRRAARPTVVTCVDWVPPGHVAWRWEDEGDSVDVAYALEPVWTSTRLIWRRELRARRLGAARHGTRPARAATAARTRVRRRPP